MRPEFHLFAITAAVALCASSPLGADGIHFDTAIHPPIPPEAAYGEADAPPAPKAVNPDRSLSSAKLAGPIAAPVSEVTGALSGKIVYLMSGHGWTYDSPGVWYTQRPLTNSMVEDFGNLDQGTIMADLLLNAGATVVPLRPFGIQEREVVIDNDDPECTFAGSWTDSTATHFYGTTGDVPYRFAGTVTTSPTHTAEYNASNLLPVSGYYPVYVWTRWGPDRIAQQYIIAHSGGTTSRRVNHQRVGSGWVYLGTFHFQQGGPASVTITNQELAGDPGSVVIADAVRFGNGMGDSRRDGEASGYPRHEENAAYWLVESRGVGSGLSSVGSVSDPPRLAAYMNYESGTNSGAVTDRLYVSFHSNAGGGRGADGLFNNNPGDSCSDPATANSFNTPNGLALAIELGTRINTDMTLMTNALGNPFENTWGQSGAGSNIFGSGCGGEGGFSAYGEINNSTIGGEFAATIIEVAFHDNALDAALMRDPKMREALARSTYHGIVNHFNAFGGSPQVYTPEQPDNPWVVSDISGNLTLNWIAPVAGGPYGAGGGAPTGYIVEVSQNGRGFAPALTIAGGATTSANVTSLVPAGQHRYLRVVATNAGGVSFPSIVVGARRSAGKATALVVNGFDRYDRTLNYRQTAAAYLGSQLAGGGTFDRVIPRYNNRFDYVVEMGDALAAAGVTFDACQNEQIISGAVSLGSYDSVYWILGAESTVTSAFNATERAAVTGYLAANGNLFLSGSEVAWDLGRTGGSASDPAFLENRLRVARFSSNALDDAGVYSATGAAGSIFASLGTVTFSDGSNIHGDFDVAFPDVLVPFGGSTTAMRYTNVGTSSAAIQYDGSAGGTGRVVFIGFPLETILDGTKRQSIIASTAAFFQNPTRVENWMIFRAE